MSNTTGNGPPPKPWERAPSSSGPAPFKPPSPGSTSDVVEASGTARPGEIVTSSSQRPLPANTAIARPVPTRPWEQNYGSSYGGAVNTGYGSGLNYNSGYGGALGSSYGGTYGGGMYGGSSMYNRGGGYGGMYGGSSMYGGAGGMYGGGMGSTFGGGYGMGMGGGMGGPYGEQDPNDPYGAPPSPPGFWISFLRVMQGVVTFFGRVAMLIDQNTQAFHMFMSAMLQLFDRSGMLYGELARFVFRLLGIKTKPRKVHPGGPEGYHPQFNGPNGQGQNYIEGPKSAPAGSWDNVWGNDNNGM
ncbi:hypothetical protein ACHQM5_028511 [Ranunculus cassubicifolius]